MKNLIYLLIAALLAFNFSCKDSGTGPEEKKSVQDYTWTADTLTREGSIQTLMRSIWGSSANDIYICGHNDDAYGKIWHYDGKEWEYIDSTQNIRQQFGGANYQTVHGTAANNVWAVGYSGTNYQGQEYSIPFILEYNGTSWKKHIVNTKSAVYSVYVVSSNDVWACGADGIVYHYNGNSWDIDTIKIPPPTLDYQLNNIIKYKDKIYCFGRNSAEQGAKHTYYFFEKSSSGWVKVDSFVIQTSSLEFKWGPSAFYISKDNKLYSHGSGGVFEFNSSSWNNIFHTDYAITDMSGVEANDFLFSAIFGHVIHYNGSTWKELTNLKKEDVIYTGVWRDDGEAFIIGNDFSSYPQTTIVLHGK